MARLPLCAEVFLLAHNDDTGQPHIHRQALTMGLAGAILLDLWLTRHVVIGWAPDPQTRVWAHRPGVITPTTGQPTGDRLRDAALATVNRTRRRAGPHSHLQTWLRALAHDHLHLYEWVRDDMIAAGVLRPATRRRLGILSTSTHLAAHHAWAIRARARIREAATGRPGHEPPDEQCTALCGLVYALDLAPFLYSGIDDLRRHLRRIVDQHPDPALRDTTDAVDAGRGDLALTAMR
ncbi:GPP34 family phosphoprotein [Micromonospora sp. WMMA1363]|uniref:GOLPH3/VPS74 family protein n=1 Tax=Micromonospora sp. WMMA1363 TaxID=3053985 RepID=UPI00259D254A|nr:GPP34 family phosphoprotein [Micromonospora sp. WMMA1363]MDM4723296.1 GPP34 family phosphoprotein [Micromonospora sp. WMMA1363]MDM4723390.1 GPP34 family phosphoprotein [Micromonospora sp. WMMA1363]